MVKKKVINNEIKIHFNHNKKLLKIIFFLLVLLGIFIAIGYNLNKIDKNKNQKTEWQICVTDADCVVATCCHPFACVSITEKPDCNDIFCTQECAPGTLDCNQGYCACINGKCKAVFNG